MPTRQQMTTLMLFLTIILITANISCSKGIENEPLAWIHFTKHDKKVARFNNFYYYYVGGVPRVELDMHVDPEAKHKLAFMWICKEGPPRSMKIVVNGKEKVVTKKAVGNGKQSFFWDIIPVTEFGINKEEKGKYRIVVSYPEGAQEDALLGGVRLITDEKQVEKLMLMSGSRKTQFIFPGTMSKEQRQKTRVDRTAAKKRVIKNWVGKKKLSKSEVQKDEFLSAAVKFAAYTFSGLCAAVAGLIYTSNIRAADPSKTGLFLELDAIMAVVIGGTALTGGRFYLLGSLVGALLIQTLTTTMLMHGLSTDQALVPKAVMVVAVCLLQSAEFRRRVSLALAPVRALFGGRASA